ncbi:hypothetical protein l11_17320 [Neisseria weaveri LMG 5135]|nr:hypothetical protein l11_17320 [Neisseria weaveri LMG 5135]
MIILVLFYCNLIFFNDFWLFEVFINELTHQYLQSIIFYIILILLNIII